MDSLTKSAPRTLSAAHGYALPSVLVVVTIISLVIAALLLYRSIDLRLALNDVRLVKAEFAAESGIARTLASGSARRQLSFLLADGPFFHEFPDGSKARVEIRPWGILVLAASEGEYHGTAVVRRALVGERPLGAFRNALVFGNSDHELVIAGNSSIRGDVVVGSPGVATGHARGGSAAPQIPLKGAIRKELNPTVPVPALPQLVVLVEEFNELTKGTSSYLSALPSTVHKPDVPEYPALVSGDIPDSIRYMFVGGDARIEAEVRRFDIPLTIVVRGSAWVDRNVRLEGLVALYASNDIRITSDAVIESAVFVSGGRIEIEAGAKLVGQWIAPAVTIGDRTVLKYPSVVLSSHLFSAEPQSISIGAAASVEGLLALAVPNEKRNITPALVIPASAKVVGCAISTGRLNLNGTVIGSVLTRDFEFTEAPTRYLGWMRGGSIDRNALPSAFLLPPGLSGQLKLEVLDWL